MKEWLEEMTDKKEEEFRVQFKDSIQIMAGALKPDIQQKMRSEKPAMT